MNWERVGRNLLVRVSITLVVGLAVGFVSRPIGSPALANGFYPCAEPVTNFTEFRNAVATYVAPGSTCTAIRLGADIDVVGRVDIFGLDDSQLQVPVGRSLTIFGDNHWLIGDGSTSSLIIDIDDDSGNDTFAVFELGVRNFGGSGALSIVSGSTNIASSRFIDNAFLSGASVDGLGDSSAGAVNAFGSLVIVNSEFTGNSGSLGGAVHNVSQSQTYVTNTTFANNSASSVGGAAYIDGSVIVQNSTFTANSAPSAGALNVTGAVEIDFSTIVDNTSTNNGAAVTATGNVDITRSIVFGNPIGSSEPPEFADIATEGSITVTSSLLTSETSTTSLLLPTVMDTSNIVGEDPQLFPLGDYGGFMLPGGVRISTRPPRSGSPVIDTIVAPPMSVSFEPLDQRGIGFARFFNGLADMGAVEYRPMHGSFDFRWPNVDEDQPDALPNTR